MNSPRQLLVAAALVVATAGCQSTGTDQAAKTAGTMQKMATEFDAAPAEVDAVVAALTALIDGKGDMRKDYDAYNKDVAKIESRAERIRGLRKELEGNRDEFAKSWAEHLKTIQSEDLRKRGEQRRDKVIAAFGELTTKGQAVGAIYNPWMTQLIDIKKYLEHDLNPEGVKSIADMTTKVTDGATQLKTELESLNGEFRRVAEAIKSASPPPPAASAGTTPPSTGSN
jgi:hypothetical protein